MEEGDGSRETRYSETRTRLGDWGLEKAVRNEARWAENAMYVALIFFSSFLLHLFFLPLSIFQKKKSKKRCPRADYTMKYRNEEIDEFLYLSLFLSLSPRETSEQRQHTAHENIQTPIIEEFLYEN